MTVRKLASDKEVVPINQAAIPSSNGKAPAALPDDISEVVSIRSNTPSLHEEPLPSYADVEPQAAAAAPVPEKASAQQGPTAASPFNFPQAELPSYEATIDIQRPLAIPQVSPALAAPLLAAYPPELLSYGIPEDSWYSFVDTVSAFLSADVSKQALHHAAEIATKMKDYHSDYAAGVVKQAKHIGKNAKNLNLFGVVGGTLGLVFGTVGHAVGTVVSRPLTSAITSRPKTPRERATVYIATANQDWFHARGLHALLVDTAELAAVIGVSPQPLLEVMQKEETKVPAEQLAALRKWVADVEIRESQPGLERLPSQSSQPAWTMAGRASTSASSSKPSKAATTKSQFYLSSATLWLVIIQRKRAQELMAEIEAGNA